MKALRLIDYLKEGPDLVEVVLVSYENGKTIRREIEIASNWEHQERVGEIWLQASSQAPLPEHKQCKKCGEGVLDKNLTDVVLEGGEVVKDWCVGCADMYEAQKRERGGM